jgi:hypothetical protein
VRLCYAQPFSCILQEVFVHQSASRQFNQCPRPGSLHCCSHTQCQGLMPRWPLLSRKCTCRGQLWQQRAINPVTFMRRSTCTSLVCWAANGAFAVTTLRCTSVRCVPAACSTRCLCRPFACRCAHACQPLSRCTVLVCRSSCPPWRACMSVVHTAPALIILTLASIAGDHGRRLRRPGEHLPLCARPVVLKDLNAGQAAAQGPLSWHQHKTAQ